MQKKKKVILATGIVITVIVISALLFFIVFQNNPDKSNFLGKWKILNVDYPEWYEGNYSDFITFHEDGRVSQTHIFEDASYGSGNETGWGTYELQGDKLFLSVPWNEENEDLHIYIKSNTIWFYYDFSESNNHLTLRDIGAGSDLDKMGMWDSVYRQVELERVQ